MCGIAGIVSSKEVNQDLYEALTVLQHRGQDAAGIVTCEGDRFHLRKDSGLVRDVFHTRHMVNLRGTMGLAHVRYPTAGCISSAEAQPLYVNSPYGITLAHNVGSPAEVDAVIEEARAAGATITREPGETFWGGYNGVFADPDGHPWEIAHNPHWTIEPDGAVRL